MTYAVIKIEDRPNNFGYIQDLVNECWVGMHTPKLLFTAAEIETIDPDMFETESEDDNALIFTDVDYEGQQKRWRSAVVVEGEIFDGKWEEHTDIKLGKLTEDLINAMKTNFKYPVRLLRIGDVENGKPDSFQIVFGYNDDEFGPSKYVNIVVEPLEEEESAQDGW